MSPAPPMASAAISICFWPIRAGLDGFNCIKRPSLARPLSKEMTLMPRCMAFLVIGTSAFASLAEMTMALTFWLISELMISICPSAVAVVGPV
ncbi:hypothetical protein D3C81_851860 [compost metagenome]